MDSSNRNKVLLAIVGVLLLVGLSFGIARFLASRDAEAHRANSEEVGARAETASKKHAEQINDNLKLELQEALKKGLETGRITAAEIEAEKIKINGSTWAVSSLSVGEDGSYYLDIDGAEAKVFLPLSILEIKNVGNINSTGTLVAKTSSTGNVVFDSSISGLNGGFAVDSSSGQPMLAVQGKISATEFSLRDDAFKIEAGGHLTLAGRLNVGGVASLKSDLNVLGSTNLKATNVDGALDVAGVTTLGNTLSVTGATTLSGGATVENGLSVNSGTTSLKNTEIGGTLTVSGTTGVGGALNVTDATVLNGGASIKNGLTVVDGQTILQNTDIFGDAKVSGTLTAGALSADVLSASSIEVTGTLTVGEDASFGRDISVAGAGSFLNINSTESVATSSTVSGQLTAGEISVLGHMSVDGTLTVNSGATFVGLVKLNGAFSVSSQYGGEAFVFLNGPGTMTVQLSSLDPGWLYLATPQSNPQGVWWVTDSGLLSLETTQTSGESVWFSWFAFKTH